MAPLHFVLWCGMPLPKPCSIVRYSVHEAILYYRERTQVTTFRRIPPSAAVRNLAVRCCRLLLLLVCWSLCYGYRHADRNVRTPGHHLLGSGAHTDPRADSNTASLEATESQAPHTTGGIPKPGGVTSRESASFDSRAILHVSVRSPNWQTAALAFGGNAADPILAQDVLSKARKGGFPAERKDDKIVVIHVGASLLAGLLFAGRETCVQSIP